jgi:hypothetical protein
VNRRDFYPGSIQAPAWCPEVLHKFGQNRYQENLFRVVFLPSRCTVVGGYWERDGELQYKLMPKYGRNEQKWALERYVPASFLGSPESWEVLLSTIEGYYAIGPFPEHGIFECCAVFTLGRGEAGYVPLEPDMVNMQARLVWMGRQLTRYQVRSQILGEEEEKIKREDEHFERLLRQNSYTRDNPTYGMAATYNRETAVEDYKLKIIKSKAWARKHRFTQGFSQHGAN